MVEELKIGTWNIKNGYFSNKLNDGKIDAIIDVLEKEKPDFLNLQEVNAVLAKKLDQELKQEGNQYQITSNYRFGISPIRNLRVEYNTIISKIKPVDPSSYQLLPFFSWDKKMLKFWNMRLRNITSQMFKTTLFVYNTHLDPYSYSLREKQMEMVVQDLGFLGSMEFIKQNTILTGTINAKPDDSDMVNFTKSLHNLDLKVLENPHNTYIGHIDNQPVDYIIVPKRWDVESVETLKNHQDVSSHLPVIAKVIRK